MSASSFRLRSDLDGDWCLRLVRRTLATSPHTIEGAALQIGVHRSTISRWLNGHGRMRDDTVCQLMDYLGLTARLDAALGAVEEGAGLGAAGRG